MDTHVMGLTWESVAQFAILLAGMVTIVARVESTARGNKADIEALKKAMASQHRELKDDMRMDFKELKTQIGHLHNRSTASETLLARTDSVVIDHSRRIGVVEERIERIAAGGIK
jgi:hypothetical protein